MQVSHARLVRSGLEDGDGIERVLLCIDLTRGVEGKGKPQGLDQVGRYRCDPGDQRCRTGESHRAARRGCAEAKKREPARRMAAEGMVGMAGQVIPTPPKGNPVAARRIPGRVRIDYVAQIGP